MAKPSLPWNLPQESQDLTYTEYFSVERPYDTGKDLRCSTELDLIADPENPWYWTGVYTLIQDGESLRVVPYKTSQETWVVNSAEAVQDCVWTVAAPDRAFGIREGKELVSVDYLSGEITCLYRDETEAMADLLRQQNGSGLMILAEDRVLYFLAGCENALGLYRVYLPEGQVDLVYGGIPLDTKPFLEPLLFTSSRKVGWTESNPEYDALMQELNTPDSPYLEKYYAGLGPDQEPDRFTVHDILDEAIRRDYGLEPSKSYQYEIETGILSIIKPEFAK